MVQAGVNPFPAGPGFTAAPTLNATDGNLPVTVAVKNDALATALKPEANVNITPAISVAQVSVGSTTRMKCERLLTILEMVGLSAGRQSVQSSHHCAAREPSVCVNISTTSIARSQRDHFESN